VEREYGFVLYDSTGEIFCSTAYMFTCTPEWSLADIEAVATVAWGGFPLLTIRQEGNDIELDTPPPEAELSLIYSLISAKNELFRIQLNKLYTQKEAIDSFCPPMTLERAEYWARLLVTLRSLMGLGESFELYDALRPEKGYILWTCPD
jgi:hypothetical protein